MPHSSSQSADEVAYAAVLEELRRGVRDEPLMAKAYAEAEGDENRARALYLRWRAAKLRPPPSQSPPGSGPPGGWRRTPWARRSLRSWSTPRAYDLLLVLAALLALFLFNSDFHNGVLQLLHAQSGRVASSSLFR
jgi:hypothetical protein